MFDAATPLRMTSVWNETVFRSVLSTAVSLAAFGQESARMWTKTVAPSRATPTWPSVFDAFSVWPRLPGVEGWPYLFWMPRLPPSWLFALGWRAFRPADWMTIASSIALTRSTQMWLRPTIPMWPLQALAPAVEPARVAPPLRLPPPPAPAFAAYRSDSGFAAAHAVWCAQIATAAESVSLARKC